MKWAALALALTVSLIAAKPAPPKPEKAPKKPDPKKAKVAEDFSRLLNAEETVCYTDADCEGYEFCGDNGMCESATICYGDDECRGREVCDMNRYICVEPTPSPIWTTPSPTTPSPTNPPPGCCRGSSYKAQAKCFGLEDQNACERKDCEWVETEDPNDCVITTTTTTTSTTTEEPGCCSSMEAKKFDMCNAKEGREKCERSNSCFFIPGLDALCEPPVTTIAPGCCAATEWRGSSKCLPVTTESHCSRLSNCYWIETEDPNDCVLTTTTEAPGCCTGDSYKANAKCSMAQEQSKCESKGCRWLETDDPSDCVVTTTETPTTTAEPGCCGSDKASKFEMCNAKETQSTCERSSSCHWTPGKDVVCEPPVTTTEPGCCYGNPNNGYSKRWMDKCTEYYTERDCLMLTGDDGSTRCVWEEIGENYDCSMLWPTTTTTTEMPGCCRGTSYKAQAKCYGIANQNACERKDCEWVETFEESDCDLTTTSSSPTTTEEPGCCGSDKASKFEMCNEKETRDKCERGSSCHWNSGSNAICEPPVTTINPGCCYGNPDAAYSKRWMDTCTAYDTERECLMLTDSDGNYRCAWEDLVDGYDCSLLWPTTTTTTEAPGCCRGSSYKGQAKCFGVEDAVKCARANCEWVETDDPNDCVLTTTSTTEEPGCCMGDSAKTFDKCNVREGRDQCERSSSCFFISGVEAICEPPVTTTEPGCCYGNPDAAYSKRWMDSCTAFYTEKECLMLTDDDGNYRCAWESKSVNYDCSQLWPTTTTTTVAPGCCRGSSYKAQAKCFGLEDQKGCERKDCEWVETEDPNDCVITTTSSSPTTTEEPGCCKGDAPKSNDMCNARDDRVRCEKSSSCHWIVTNDFSQCTYPPTTTEEPGCCYGNPDAAYSKRWMDACTAFYTERDCLLLTDSDGSYRCHWEAKEDEYDCSQLWPTTTTTTETPGCCAGSDYKSSGKCQAAASQSRCELLDNCSWLETDDPKDCVQTTTEEVGCCAGLNKASVDKCAEKEGREQCERTDKCEFREGEYADCSWPTTTSEPWLGAKPDAAEDFLPKPKPLPKDALPQPKPKPKNAIDKSEALLFGDGETVVAQAMQTQVSLSSLLLVVIAAIAAYQLYQRCTTSKKDEIVNTSIDLSTSTYQTA